MVSQIRSTIFFLSASVTDESQLKEDIMKSFVMAALAASTMLAVTPAFAADEINVAPGISAAGAPLALHGADPVALLNGDKVALGSSYLSGTHNGASYYFTSPQNAGAFMENPDRYEPQNGGFCTYGVSVGKKFDGDPRHFVVHDDKLFVFLNAATRDLFLEDIDGTIANADAQWEKIQNTAAAEL